MSQVYISAYCDDCQYPYMYDSVEYGYCPKCGTLPIKVKMAKSLPAVMHEKERPVVYEHPSGNPRMEPKYPGRNDVQMPERYKTQGYVRREFTSLREHEKWQKERGLVNHKTWDIKD